MKNELSIQEPLEKFLRLSVANGDASPRTVQAYRDNIRYYGSWAAKQGIDPLEASHDDILAYRASLVPLYARSTIRLRLTAVKLLYRALSRWGGRLDNPAAGILAPKAREGASSAVLARGLSPDTAKKLLEASVEGRDGALVRLMVLHGLRAGEVSRLISSDVSRDGTQLSVPGKGGKRRTLILSYRCRQDLDPLRAATGPIFRRRGGGTLSVRSIERAVGLALEKIGAKEPGKSCHSLRHAFGILSAIGGARPEAISEAMGHADLKTTAIYTRAAWAYMENPTDAVERALLK